MDNKAASEEVRELKRRAHDLGYYLIRKGWDNINWPELARLAGFGNEVEMFKKLYRTDRKDLTKMPLKQLGAFLGVSAPSVRQRMIVLGLERAPVGGHSGSRYVSKKKERNHNMG